MCGDFLQSTSCPKLVVCYNTCPSLSHLRYIISCYKCYTLAAPSPSLQLLHDTWRCQAITSYCITLHAAVGSTSPHYITLDVCGSVIPLHHIVSHFMLHGVNFPPLHHYITSNNITLHEAAGSTSLPLNLNLTPTSSFRWWWEGSTFTFF